MEWTLQIDEQAAQWLELWCHRLPNFRALMAARLAELTATADPHLGPICPPMMTHACPIYFPTEFPRPVLVTLFVDRLEAQRILRVRSGRLAFEPQDAPGWDANGEEWLRIVLR